MAQPRARQTGELLARIWGPSLPPSELPYEAIAEDAASLDDALGRQQGQVVRGDSVMVEDIAALLAQCEPSAVTERVALALRLTCLAGASGGDSG